MKRFLFVFTIVVLIFGPAPLTNADIWRWNDNFIAAFVDAEGINRHPGSSEQGEQFAGKMTGTRDVAGPDGIYFPYTMEPGAMDEALSDYFGNILTPSQSPLVDEGGGFKTSPTDFAR